MSHAECVEYQIIDHGGSVEAVCVGAPLNDAEKKQLENQYSLDGEKERRNAIIDCQASLPSTQNSMTYINNKDYYDQEAARCRKLEVDLSMYTSLRPKKNNYEPASTVNPFDNTAALAAELQAQQAEIQRQQFEIQRMQQQQKFNQIWKK